jgi:CRP-like cAMP-binding protein
VKNELIKFAPLFAGLTDSERELLAAGFAEGQSPAHTMLLTAGERSEAMYLIGQGFVSLATPSGANLATLGPGSLLGDAGLFRNAPQDVNAVALSDISFWKLTDSRLRELILQQPTLGLKLGRNFGGLLAQMQEYLAHRLADVPELATVPAHTLRAMAERLHPREIKAQDALYRAGDTPSGLFVLESGALELHRDSADDDQTPAVKPGHIVGALALLTGKSYVENAVAVQESLVWVLSAEDFAAISTQHPGLRRALARATRTRLSKSDQSQAVLRLAQMPLFADATPQTIQAIAQRMVLQHTPAGERVYMMGEMGDALYLIENGEVGLSAENAGGVVEESARISKGGFFGEMGLLTGQIRSEDATAIRNTNLWILPKSEMDALAAKYPDVGKALSQGLAAQLSSREPQYSEDRFREFELFAELGATELQQVVNYLQPTRYRAGEQIFRAATPADKLYLLEKGQVRMQPLSGGAWALDAGEAFGERALLTNQPHNASALAETDVDVWTLSKSDFDMLMNRYPMLAISMSRILSQRLTQSQQYPGPAAGVGQAGGPVYDDSAFEDEPEDELSYAPTGVPIAGNMPSRRRQQAAASLSQNRGEAPPRTGVAQWFAQLSTQGKVLLTVLVLLLIWLIAIAAPAAMMSLLQGTTIAGGREMTGRASLLNAINAVYAEGSYELAEKDQTLAQALAMADQAVPPTPTYTPAPTITPIPSPTPLPTATPTPLPTATTAPTAVPFIAQFVPPPAAPTEVPAPAQVAEVQRVWDGRLSQLGVVVEDAPAQPGQQYWKLIEARWADEQESGGKHHIYVEVLDENGSRIVGQPVTVFWGDGSYTSGIEDKAPPDYGYNYQMYAAGNAYNVKVEGLPSDTLRGAGMGDLDKPRYGIHTSFYLVYQKATR